MALPKVLVGIVTYEGKDYIFPTCYDAVTKFNYPNYDILIVDNSATLDYYHELINRGYSKVVHIKRASNTRDTLSDSQNYVRNYCIRHDYEYVLFVESDLVPPPNVIQRLMSYSKPVVGSVYWLEGKMQDGTKAKIPCIFFTQQKATTNVTHTRLITQAEVEKFLLTGLRLCHGMGLGCTLIERRIIERYPFWTDERFANKHSDVYLYMDLHNTHIPVFIDTDLIIPHFPSDWGQVIDR
jgi:glycosyltransferase involved in cell wall biosynthesis